MLLYRLKQKKEPKLEKTVNFFPYFTSIVIYTLFFIASNFLSLYWYLVTRSFVGISKDDFH